VLISPPVKARALVLFCSSEEDFVSVA